MKVYVLFDDKEIVNIYASKQDADDDALLGIKRTIQAYEVIPSETEIKSITEVNKKVYDPKHMDSDMPFGKYQGKTIGDIIEEDPGYIKWAVNILNFSIDEECMEFLTDQLQKQRRK